MKIVMEVILFLIFYGAVIYFIFLWRRKINAANERNKMLIKKDNDSNNNRDDGNEPDIDALPLPDLPTGVYVLPPDAPDPSERKPNKTIWS